MSPNENNIYLSKGLKSYFYPHLFSAIYKARTDYIVNNIRGNEILDAGSGRGNISLCVKKLGCSVTAVDLSDSSLKEACFIFEKEDADIFLLCASLTDLPLEDAIFDTIICTDVLEHVSDAKRALNEFRRVLKKRGRIIFSIPNPTGFDFIYDQIITRIISLKKQTAFAYKRHYKITDRDIKQFGWCNKIIYPHCQKFTINKFTTLLNSAGFKIAQVDNIRFLHPYFRAFFTLLGIGPVNFLERLDITLAKIVPHKMAADWFFICEKE